MCHAFVVAAEDQRIMEREKAELREQALRLEMAKAELAKERADMERMQREAVAAREQMSAERATSRSKPPVVVYDDSDDDSDDENDENDGFEILSQPRVRSRRRSLVPSLSGSTFLCRLFKYS